MRQDPLACSSLMFIRRGPECIAFHSSCEKQCPAEAPWQSNIQGLKAPHALLQLEAGRCLLQ